MSFLDLFHTRLASPTNDIVVSVVLTTKTRLNYRSKFEDGILVLRKDDENSDTHRFGGLRIRVSDELSYNPLEKNPVGYRFFSFEGVERVEIAFTGTKYERTANSSAASTDSVSRFDFDVDQNTHKLVNMRLTLDFQVIGSRMRAAWENGVVMVREGDGKVARQLIERPGSHDDFLRIVQKLQTQRILNFI